MLVLNCILGTSLLFLISCWYYVPSAERKVVKDIKTTLRKYPQDWKFYQDTLIHESGLELEWLHFSKIRIIKPKEIELCFLSRLRLFPRAEWVIVGLTTAQQDDAKNKNLKAIDLSNWTSKDGRFIEKL